MKFSRRDFVKFGGISAIASLGFSRSIFAFSGDDVLAAQSAESFRALIGTDFYFWRDNNSLWGKLTKVEDFPNSSNTGECFSMLFEISAKNAEQATYDAFHPKIGNFELFMTEGRLGKRRALTAVINRI